MTIDITLTTDELYEICNALNTLANEHESDARKRRAKGHTYQQIAVVEQAAVTLRALSARLIADKNEQYDPSDDENLDGTHDALDASLNNHAFHVGPGKSAGDY